MNDQIYYYEDEKERGPVSLEQLRSLNLSADVLVWYDGLLDWTPINEAPLTASILSEGAAQTPVEEEEPPQLPTVEEEPPQIPTSEEFESQSEIKQYFPPKSLTNKNTKIYFIEDGKRKGPFTMDQLRCRSLNPDTFVWYEDLDDWSKITEAPLTAHLYNKITSIPKYTIESESFQNKKKTIPSPKTNIIWILLSFLVWATLAIFSVLTYEVFKIKDTIFLLLSLLPLFYIIKSIISELRVQKLYKGGLYKEAFIASRMASNWAGTAVLLSFIIFILPLVVNVIYSVFS